VFHLLVVHCHHEGSFVGLVRNSQAHDQAQDVGAIRHFDAWLGAPGLGRQVMFQFSEETQLDLHQPPPPCSLPPGAFLPRPARRLDKKEPARLRAGLAWLIKKEYPLNPSASV